MGQGIELGVDDIACDVQSRAFSPLRIERGGEEERSCQNSEGAG